MEFRKKETEPESRNTMKKAISSKEFDEKKKSKWIIYNMDNTKQVSVMLLYENKIIIVMI